MCMLITAMAAVVTTALWRLKYTEEELMLGRLAFMYWGAAIMWLVDGFYRIAEKEAFFDMSVDDAMLGILIIVCGLAALAVMRIVAKVKKISNKSF